MAHARKDHPPAVEIEQQPLLAGIGAVEGVAPVQAEGNAVVEQLQAAVAAAKQLPAQLPGGQGIGGFGRLVRGVFPRAAGRAAFGRLTRGGPFLQQPFVGRHGGEGGEGLPNAALQRGLHGQQGHALVVGHVGLDQGVGPAQAVRARLGVVGRLKKAVAVRPAQGLHGAQVFGGGPGPHQQGQGRRIGRNHHLFAAGAPHGKGGQAESLVLVVEV